MFMVIRLPCTYLCIFSAVLARLCIQFQFFGVGVLSFRSRRACHNQAKLLTKCGTKWARHTAPFLEPIGAISVAVPKQGSMELGAKIGSPQNTRAHLWTKFALPRDAILKYINQSSVPG